MSEKRNLYLVQTSSVYGGKLFKSAYLPYAVGLLAANAWTFEEVKNNYNLNNFVFYKEDTDKVVEELENPAVMGFSCYIWNTEYNKVLAQKVKKKYPDCVIIFGGHNVSPNEDFLKEYDYIDFLIHAEGEDAFPALLKELIKDNPDFSKVPNLSYRTACGLASTKVERLTRTDYPSPYLSGIFEKIYAEHSDMQLDAIIETSRGCPHNCAYCDWGCNNGKIKLYPMERILAEIDWFSAHKTAFIWGADANFGLYDRDMEIVDKLVENRAKTGYPERLRINYAKDREETVFQISRKLEKYGMSKTGTTLSFQSLDETVLKNIGRQNMGLEHFHNLISRYRKAGVPTYSELILGLPGETYESFCRGIGILLKYGQHRTIDVYYCELLPNSPMAAPDYMEKFGIKIATIPHLTAHVSSKNEVEELSRYIVETKSMSSEDWIRSAIFASFEKSMHHYGMLKCVSCYLFYEKGIRYEDFYNALIDWVRTHEGTIGYDIYKFLYDFHKKITLSMEVNLYNNPEIYGDIGWPTVQTPFMASVYRMDKFFEELDGFLRSYDIEDYEELMRYQKCILKRPDRNHFSESFKKDWYTYFNTIFEGGYEPLTERENIVHIDNEVHKTTWPEYALEAAWFEKNGMTFNPGIKVEYVHKKE